MYMFLKRRFLFSSLVLLKIIKAVTKCIFSAVINVCNEIECILKSAENFSTSQNVPFKMETNSSNNYHLNPTRSQASYSVNRNINAASVRFLISNLPCGKKVTVRHKRHEVVANISDVTYHDLTNFPHRPETIRSTTLPVCSKPDNSFPCKIPEPPTPFDLGSKTSESWKDQQKTIGIKILPECERSLKNTKQVLIDQTSNASAGSSCLKLNTSDEVQKLNLNESKSSGNKFSESASENIPQQIKNHDLKSPTVDAANLHPRDVHQKNKTIQKNEKYFKDHECDSEIVATVIGDDNNSKKQLSMDNESQPELVTFTHNASPCDHNVSEEQNFIDDECHSELVMALENVSQRQKGENQSVESEKNEHIRGNNSQDTKQVKETKEEVKINASKRDNNLTPCSPLFPDGAVCSDETVFHSDVTANPKIFDAEENSTLNEDFFSLRGLLTSVNQFIVGVTGSPSHFDMDNSSDESNPPSLEAKFNLLKTGNSGYIEFLRKINPLLQEFETELLNLCKVHYRKSVISREEVVSLSLKLVNIEGYSKEVNAEPYHDIVFNYLKDITALILSIQNESMDHSNSMKRSFYLKEVTRRITEKRNILFHVNQETKALQKQIQKVGKIPPKQIKNTKGK